MLALGLALGLLAGQIQRPAVAPPLEPVIRALGLGAERPERLTEAQRAVAHAAGRRMVSLCPSCRLTTIDEEGPCGWARASRGLIEQAAARGDSAEAIVATWVGVYGEGILAVPTDRGFAATSWRLPIAAGLLGLVAFVAAGLRARRRGTPEPPSPAASTVDADARAELERALAELD
jgi:cytochrome c-type biogenesis protein CcmH/NrfF